MIKFTESTLGTIYGCKYAPQPDATAWGNITPNIDTIKTYDLYSKATELRNACQQAQTDMNTTYYFMAADDTLAKKLGLQFIYDLATDTMTVNAIEYYSGSAHHGATLATYTYPYSGDNREMIVLLRLTRDDMTSVELTEKYNVIITMDLCYLWVGTYQAPTTAHPYGEMDYNVTGSNTNISILPLAPICINNSEQSVSEQAQAIGYKDYDMTWFNMGDSLISTVVNGDGSTPEDVDENGDPSQDPDEEDDGGNSGGDGDHVRDNDPIPVPGLPSVTAAGAGFFTMYKMSTSEILSFADHLFDSSLWNQIKVYFQKPFDFIAGLMILPVTPQHTNLYYPKFGATTWPEAYRAVANQFYELDCGTVEIKEYYKNCYDYSPYTKMLLWLPYVGFQELNPDDVMGKTISIKYHIDVSNGSCVAFVSTTGDTPVVLGEYSGNCGVQVPVTNVSYDSVVSNGIALLTTGIGLAVGGAAGGALTFAKGADMTGAAALVSATASAVSGMKPNVSRNGSVGASAGYMGVQKPYIIRYIPRLKIPNNMRTLNGYSCNMGGSLGEFSGFVAIDKIKITGFTGTQSEYNELLSILKEGVYI